VANDPFNGITNSTRAFATGKVTDRSGKVVPNAKIIVVNQYHGGLRMNEDVFQTTTDENGQWKVQGLRTSYSTVVVAAFTDEHFVQYDRVQRKIGFRNSGASFEHDSVLSKSGANVRVHVLKQGQPIQSGYARLSVTDWQQSMGVGWARTLPEQRKWRDSIWQFVERIDQTGHATFKNIPPGEYHIEAIAGADASFDKISDIPVARYDGLCLIPGANNQVTVQLAKANRDLRFRIHTPNGKLSGPKRIGIQYGRTTMNTSTSRVPGKDGVLSFSLQQVGMHQMKFEAKDADVRRVPTIDPKYVLPYIVGVSSLYPNDQPIDIHLLEHSEEVVRVQLHDRNN
jgi:hypothetical protein